VIENAHGKGQMEAATLGIEDLVRGLEGMAGTENVPVMT